MSTKNKQIEIKGVSVSVFQSNKDDVISLTDIAKSIDGDSIAADIIKNWIRNRGTIEFIGTWEQLHNPNFKVVEFDHFKMNAGLTSFVLSPGKWVEKTGATVFVKVVVRFIHAAFNKTSSSARISFGGFSHTSVIWLQSLISPDQRLGLRLFACL